MTNISGYSGTTRQRNRYMNMMILLRIGTGCRKHFLHLRGIMIKWIDKEDQQCRLFQKRRKKEKQRITACNRAAIVILAHWLITEEIAVIIRLCMKQIVSMNNAPITDALYACLRPSMAWGKGIMRLWRGFKVL